MFLKKNGEINEDYYVDIYSQFKLSQLNQIYKEFGSQVSF